MRKLSVSLCMFIIMASLNSACLCTDEVLPDEEVLPEVPDLLGIAAAANSLETRRVTFIQAKINRKDDIRWHLQWDSDCGMVIGDPNDKTRASFTAPDMPGTCNITAKLFDERMLNFNERKLTIAVTQSLEEEIIR